MRRLVLLGRRGAGGPSGGPAARRAQRFALLVVLGAAALGLATPDRASAWSWDDCYQAGAINWQSLSVNPDPITGSGAALPFRWELTYDPVTNVITRTEFNVGAPTDAPAALGLPRLSYAVADNSVGSTTYPGPPSGLPVVARTYMNQGFTADGVTVAWTLAVSRGLSDGDLGGVQVTLEHLVFGVWVEVPAVPAERVSDVKSWLKPGEYYMKTAVLGSNGATESCMELYFTNGDGGTAPVAFRAETFPFSGFSSPVDNAPTLNTVKGGAGVPVKFSLGADKGLDIFADGAPYSEKSSCDGGAGYDEIEQTSSAGLSGLQYDPASKTYTYVWNTQKGWAGTCRTLHVKLIDGTDHTARFKFR